MLGTCECIVYSVIFFSIFYTDYVLGNGFVDLSTRLLFKVASFVEKTVKEEAMKVYVVENNAVDFNVLISEITVLVLTIVFLRRLRDKCSMDHLDGLLKESKEALNQTNEFLEKWRLRRLNYQPIEYSYLDDEPQDIKPLKLKVPILHMSIIDTLGASKNQQDRGDADVSNNVIDSTILSFSSLLDEEELDPDESKDASQEVDIKERYLWHMLEKEGITDD